MNIYYFSLLFANKLILLIYVFNNTVLRWNSVKESARRKVEIPCYRLISYAFLTKWSHFPQHHLQERFTKPHNKFFFRFLKPVISVRVN